MDILTIPRIVDKLTFDSHMVIIIAFTVRTKAFLIGVGKWVGGYRGKMATGHDERSIMMADGSRASTGYPSIDKPWLQYFSERELHPTFPKNTMYGLLYERNRDHMNDIALIYFGKKITYGEMFRNIDKAAKGFCALGVREGDIVTFSMPIMPETVYALYALNRLGAICNMIDYQTNAQWIVDNLQSTGSRYILSLDLCYNAIAEVAEKADVKAVVVASLSDSMPLPGKLGYAIAMRKETRHIKNGKLGIGWREFLRFGADTDYTVPAYKPDTPAAIVYTGGTTGKPKGAVLSNDNINILACQFDLAFTHFSRGYRFLDIMPPVVPYGLCGGLHTPLVCGMSTILVPKYEVDTLDTLILKYRPTHFMAVPVCCEYLMKSKRLEGVDLSFLVFPCIGGDSMNPAVEESFNRFLSEHGVKGNLTKGYGLSEISSAVCVCRGGYNEISSVGIPLAGNTISVFKPETHRELQVGEHGEICIAAPTIMLEYFKNPASTAMMVQRHDDGMIWVHTGDYGYMTSAGAVFIIGRLKRMIIEADGYKVYPAPLENIIAAHDAVEACAVIGISDPMHFQGQLPKAYIVLKKNVQKPFEELCAELDALCSTQMHLNAVPHSYKICDSLPHTSVGKIDYRALEQLS